MNDDQRVDYPAPRLWNPNVAANWSLLFSPIFGAWVHAKNWKELGDYEKAKKSMLWVYGYTIFAVIVSFVPDFPNISVIGITVFWYTSFAKEQINYVKSGKNYEKKSWLAPILLAIVGTFILFGVIGALNNATISKDDLRSTALDLLNDSQMEAGTGFTCLSITKLEEQSDGSYHAIAEFSDGNKVKIMIKNEFSYVSVQVIEDDLLINTDKAEAGDADAQYNLGLRYYNGEGVLQDDKEAVKWWRKAAEQGEAKAQFNLGVMYAKGEGVTEDDKEAVKWYQLAAEAGNADAQYNLGLRYDNGRGVLEDDKEAVKLYRLAADQGHASAQHNLGYMYAEGEGVAEDDKEAVKWYQLAADQGNATAQYNLGYMYAEGEGVTEDKREAIKWYRLAAGQGERWAKENLQALLEEHPELRED